jgi:hypothetical protein
MNSRNGVSRSFRFIIDDDSTNALNFSPKHQALEEWTQEKWANAICIDGRVKQKFLYLHTFFRIDWSELITGEDADKLEILRNKEFTGSKIVIVPHTDLPGRRFDVVTYKSESGDSEQIRFSQIQNRANSPGNQGTVMIFMTKWPQYHWSISDPSTQQGVSAFSGKEYM